GDPQNHLDAMDAALATGEWAEARRHAEALRRRGDLNGVIMARIESALGDLALAEPGATVQAAESHYDAAAALPVDEASARLITVKRLALAWPAGPSRQQLLDVLTGAHHDAAIDLLTMQKLADRDPDRALYHYLLARQLYVRGRYGAVVEELNHPAH